MIKKITTIIYILLVFHCNAQDKEIIITDTIHIDILKFHNIVYKKCPGIMSGIPCHRFIQLVNGEFPKKTNILKKSNNVYYKIKDQTLIINLNEYKSHSIFKNFQTDQNETDSKLKLLSSVDSKKRWQVIEGIYTNAKIYVAKIRIEIINKLLDKNIMINESNDYVDVYLIR